MTVSEQKMIEDMQEKLEQLSLELKKLKEKPYTSTQFERTEADDFLLQTYN
ncbi:hypothetical protein AJ85_18170 [Alkalihalobacillus alcalophilus ATCC 27647 = CGMCC 1.3604]|uniref:Uncharacterized protein n=1 Tax=Alkalihalobacillus alcalophilus ATCC 27647 = CGMCC 1.3604 TaxID=1218173 RepID=A0A4S4K322_ALKAL|nr:hypothetical protein [Alkalihalobacillus alcalophilus]MED1563512.1 hypothetical protein [Alkalihalobacillus alcalophilus]THG92068.1 hypothetical protein AJ85_18170 [Alkalihalobacillus alcalophilus ATCC 27647 = CGMCC 1.3604]